MGITFEPHRAVRSSLVRNSGMRFARNFTSVCCLLIFAVAFALAITPTLSLGQTDSGAPSTLPRTTITPAEGGPSSPETAPSNEAMPKPVRPEHHYAPASRYSRAKTPKKFSFEVEPARARVLLTKDAWAYSLPDNLSAHIERVHAGKYVDVTGSTRYYVQVKLKSGRQAYVPISAVQLTRPTDKFFKLTSDAPVRADPNRWAKKLAEVHKGYDVHAIGIALNYVKIRMKSGLEGFIPIKALE